MSKANILYIVSTPFPRGIVSVRRKYDIRGLVIRNAPVKRVHYFFSHKMLVILTDYIDYPLVSLNGRNVGCHQWSLLIRSRLAHLQVEAARRLVRPFWKDVTGFGLCEQMKLAESNVRLLSTIPEEILGLRSPPCLSRSGSDVGLGHFNVCLRAVGYQQCRKRRRAVSGIAGPEVGRKCRPRVDMICAIHHLLALSMYSFYGLIPQAALVGKIIGPASRCKVRSEQLSFKDLQ